MPDGEVGEIAIHTGDAQPVGMFMGYHKDPELTRKAWHDGLYRTGDTAWRDEDGYYWYVGRADDVIKSSGYRIGPFEVESALMEHPAVLETAITGVPDPLRGQVVKATVVLKPGYTGSDALKSSCRTMSSGSPRPTSIPASSSSSTSCPRPSAARSAGWSCGRRTSGFDPIGRRPRGVGLLRAADC